MEKIVPKTINARLYKIVFLVITNASFVANRYLKLLKPHHGLFNIPSFKYIFKGDDDTGHWDIIIDQ